MVRKTSSRHKILPPDLGFVQYWPNLVANAVNPAGNDPAAPKVVTRQPNTEERRGPLGERHRTMSSMYALKLGFRDQTPARKLEISRTLLNRLGNFPEAHQQAVGWGALKTTCDDAQAALGEVANLKAALRAAVTRRNQAVRLMQRAAERTAHQHGIAVNYDQVQLLEGGVSLKRKRQPVGQPEAPTRLRATTGNHEGTVQLRWRRPVRRCVFFVEATTDPEGLTGWRRVAECTPQKCLLTGLATGERHWFRVAAINAHGLGPWSAVATCRPN